MGEQSGNFARSRWPGSSTWTSSANCKSQQVRQCIVPSSPPWLNWDICEYVLNIHVYQNV
eukprot:12431288-Karenia_brevis.AAC.1